MHRLRSGVRSGRFLVVLVVCAAAFGVATAVQASIPDAHGAIRGPVGKAGAWAIVQADGTVTHGANVTSVSHPSTGVYCVHLNGIDPSTVAAVATATGVVGTFDAMNTYPGACGVGGPSILASAWDTRTATLTDTGFSIVVP
jgi:hypothetical protein